MTGNQTVSDSDRKQIAAEIAAALLLIYSGHREQALATLGSELASSTLPVEAQRKILDFAEIRAEKIQVGINSRMIGAEDPEAASTSIAEYNTTTLQPFLERWAAQQGLSDAYAETSAPDGQGSARDVTQWIWTRGSGSKEPDECGDAEDASPASYDDLVSIAGGEPPRHPNCECSLSPA